MQLWTDGTHCQMLWREELRHGKRDGGKFGGYKGGAPVKSKGGGYQGQCWTSGNVGHKSSERRW